MRGKTHDWGDWFYLEDSVLATLDGLAELFCTLSLQTLVKDLLKRVHGVVHLLLLKGTEPNKTHKSPSYL